MPKIKPKKATKSPPPGTIRGRGKLAQNARLFDAPEGRDVAKIMQADFDSIEPPARENLKGVLLLLRESTMDFMQIEADKKEITRTEYIRLVVENFERVARYRRGQIWDSLGQTWIEKK